MAQLLHETGAAFWLAGEEAIMAFPTSRAFMSVVVLGAVAFGGAYLGNELLSKQAVRDRVSPVAASESSYVLVGAQGETVAPRAQVESGRHVRVDVPHARANVDATTGKVRVEAPHTRVHVDPDKGRVSVRAPYVNLDIRW
jgi:hypothetical protein